MLSLIPIFIYLIAIKQLDNFSIVKWWMLMLCGMGGIVVCLVLLLLAANITVMPDGCFPIVEEICKGSIILILILRHRIVFFAEALCYGAAVGAGFALCENLGYAFYNTGMTEMIFAFRGFGTALLHMGCTAMFATTALSISKYLAIIPGAVIHYLYNMFLLPEFIQLLLTIVFFLCMFVAINTYNDKRIYKWIDYSITDDVKLLIAIHEGKLTETPAGKYLLKIQKHFDNEVFFDIICYVQLYLEILIRGKSRMLLEQSGLAEPLTKEQKDETESMKLELHALHKNIGTIGVQILSPILRYNTEDMKIMQFSNSSSMGV